MAAYLYIAAQEIHGVLEFLVGDAQVRELQQGFGKIRVGLQRFLEKGFRGGVIALPLFDVAHVEKTGSVTAVQVQSFLKKFFCFVEAPEMAIRKAHEGKKTPGRPYPEQPLETVDGFFRFSGDEIAFSESG